MGVISAVREVALEPKRHEAMATVRFDGPPHFWNINVTSSRLILESHAKRGKGLEFDPNVRLSTIRTGKWANFVLRKL